MVSSKSMTPFAAMIVAVELLRWTKAAANEPKESVAAKVSKPSFFGRAMVVHAALRTQDSYLDAANFIQQQGGGYFTDVSPDALAAELEKTVARCQKCGVWKFGEEVIVGVGPEIFAPAPPPTEDESDPADDEDEEV